MSESFSVVRRRAPIVDPAERIAHLRFFDLSEPAGDARSEILEGLAAPCATIAPKYFYDTLGARLFESICELPEYTLTRDERAILDEQAPRLARELGSIEALIDLGAGNSEKAERLLDSFSPSQYVAVDIAGEFLRTNLQRLAGRWSELEVVGVVQDFTRGLRLPPPVRDARRLFFYPGSSIGNFSVDEAIEFLRRVHAKAAGGHLLLGADLVKEPGELVSAYDDALGVTAAFNLNVLRQVNRLAGTDFRIADWRHVALYNEAQARVEMYLEARRPLTARWLDGERRFASGERIHTENSYKYTPHGLTRLLERAGFRDVRICCDAQSRFAVAVAAA